MAYSIFAYISLAAVALIGIAFALALKLKEIMGKGRDTAPLKILLTLIFTNGILAIYSASAVYWKYTHDYLTYVQITDVVLLAIGIILVISIWKIYDEYDGLVKKHDPNA